MSERVYGMSAAKLALAIRRYQSEASDASLLQSEPVAVVGIGCRFPGGVHSPDGFWRCLLDRTDTIREAPAERWSATDWYDADPQAPGKTNSRWGSFLSDVEQFDPAFFGIAPREAPSIDPQQRLLLEVTWEALEEAGMAPDGLAGSRTGVFVAICNTDYSRLLFSDPGSIGPNSLAGGSQSIASGRISYLLDLRGPSVSIDTACSSSLVAVHLACQSLRSGECRVALAGGVALHLTPEHYIALAKLGMLSSDGRCRTFDARADGFVPGEGCGVVVLKRLADALADGDRIHAVIRGTATAQDGRTTVLTAPNGLAQQAVVRAALDNARVSPEQIGYVETHGTGTALGDPIEVEALAEVLGSGSSRCALGAVKTNLGHLEAASGIAGLIKAVLALEHEQIPANLHFDRLNEHISLGDTRFFIPTETHPWPREGAGRFVGVSSFGFGGTNAHVILEEAPRLPLPVTDDISTALVLPISARSPEALTQLAAGYRALLGDTADAAANVCRAAAVRRSHHEERIAVVGRTADELCESLRDITDHRARFGASRGRAADTTGIVLVCSGQGSQWAGMGAGLMREEPVFRSAIEACDASIRRYAAWSLIEEMQRDEATSRLEHTEFAQPAIVAMEIALAHLWKSWGIVPAAVIGHSVGEIAAAHIAGALDLDEAMRIVVRRGQLMECATGTGKMAAMFLPAADVEHEIAQFAEQVSLAAVNSPRSVVISGESAAVDAILHESRARGIDCRVLPVDYAFHSAQMEPFSSELTRVLGTTNSRRTTIPMISTVTGGTVSGTDLDAEYWGRNVRQPVRFSDAVAHALTTGLDTFVETGAHPVLSASIQECIASEGGDAVVVPSLRRNQDERTMLLASLGALYARGSVVDWQGVYRGPVPVVTLPAYPYQRQRYWVQHPSAPNAATRPPLRPLLGARVRSPMVSGAAFESQISLATLPFLADHRIGGSTILPMSGFLEMVLEAIVEETGLDGVLLEDVLVQQPLVLREADTRTVQVLLEDARFRVFALHGEEWVLHATGQFSSARAPSDGAAPATPPGSMLNVDEHYRRASTRGAHFGPAFQTVAELSAADNAATAAVRLNTPEALTASDYVIHPALLDGCFQTILATTGDDDSSWVPIAIDRFEVHAYGQRAVRSIMYHRGDGDAAATLAADAWITGDTGEAVATVTGLRLKRTTTLPTDATRFQYAVHWKPHPRGEPRVSDAVPGRWLVLGDGHGAGQALRVALEQRGEHCTVASVDAPLQSLDIDGCGGVIHMASLGARDDANAASDRDCRAVLELAQFLARQPSDLPALWFVTRDAESVTPNDECVGFAQTPVLGLARTMAIELPDLACRTLDVGPSVDVSRVVDEILLSDGEDRIALRGTDRYVARLEPHPTSTLSTNQRLGVSKRGTLDGLTREPMERRAPGAGEVEILVEAASLNFRDVMNALDMYPGEAGPLGVEFAGRIARVGLDVARWNIGDRVMGIAWGSFANHVVTPATLVTAIPVGLDVEAAATLPNAFLTAHHCLIRTARLTAGERILIHSGAGGVGMAAIQIAMDAGADVVATAGSDEKRTYLRSLGVQHVLDSRSLDFSRQIMELTDDRGVDVVLNALSGDFIGASLAALAPRGRFVEIGKVGLWTDEQVMALGKEIEYTIVDLANVVNETPRIVGEQLDHIREMTSTGRIHPLPHRVFPFEDAQAAFRYMAQARHTGRVVLRIAPKPMVRADATYLITGGLGGIGIRVARWLVEKGAKHLVLVGRSAPSSAARSAIEEIRALGATAVVSAADVTQRDQLADVLHAVSASMPPLRGVIHAAGVIDDGVLVQQTWDRFAAVLAPKVAGAWNLHELTSDADLDFFLLFSSVASVVGSPAQSAYAAGNAFLDALAMRRHALGMPALSINWGAWTGSGMAARVEEQGHTRVLGAVRPMTPEDCLDALDQAMLQSAAQIVIADVDWDMWTSGAPRLLADLVQPEPVGAGSLDRVPENDAGIVQQLALAPSANRRGLLIAFVRQEARRVLGLGDGHAIDERQPLLKLGLDSLMAVELRNRLAAALDRRLPATLLFDHPSPAALADFLIGTDSPRAQVASGDPLLSNIASMSDEEAERMLERELDRIG